MRSLARRLGVARATLYRRAGNRERLLDQMLWWRARRLLADQVQATASLAGTERLGAGIRGGVPAPPPGPPPGALPAAPPGAALRPPPGRPSTADPRPGPRPAG